MILFNFFFLQLTDAKVTRVTDYGLDVTLQPGGARAFLPKMHLSDFTENCGPMLACYERNDIISNVMHWSFSTRTNHAVSFEENKWWQSLGSAS